MMLQDSVPVSLVDSSTLLVIDDDKNLLFGLKTLLRKAKYTVLTAENGSRALDLIRLTRPDLILCDVMMPPPNGFELQRILNKDPQIADIPFVFLTARAGKEDMMSGLQNGADDYILKPFDPEVLLLKVANLLRRYKKVVQSDGQESQRQVQADEERMQVVRKISAQLYSDQGAEAVLDHTLAHLISHLKAHSIEVWWMDENTMRIEFRRCAAVKLPQEEIDLPEGSSPLSEWQNLRFSAAPISNGQGSICEIPVEVDFQKVGFVRILMSAETPPEAIKSSFMETLVNYLSIIMGKESTSRRIDHISTQKAEYTNQLLTGLTTALDLRDHNTGDHTQRVIEKTVALAKKFGLSETQVEDTRLGAMVHDIGKIAVPDNILSKPGALTAEEWKIMRMHPYYAIELLSKFDFIDRGLDIPLYHHERWDGKGYPFGLCGQQIPFSAQLFSVVDVWDALTNDRIYHKAISTEEARKIILAETGKAFSPQIVPVFLELVALD